MGEEDTERECHHANNRKWSCYGDIVILAKLRTRSQVTLPKAVMSDFQGTEYFDVTAENGRIVLTPVHLSRAGVVLAKLAELGVSEADVADAVAWARRVE